MSKLLDFHYLVEEAIEYWSEYIPNVEAIGLPHTRHTDRIDGEGVTGGQPMLINLDQWRRVHLCVLHNTIDVVPYVELHKQGLAKDHPDKDSNWIEVEHNSTFIDWMTTKSQSKGRACRDGQDGGNGQGGSKEGETGGSDGTSGISEIRSRGIVTMVNVKKKRAKGDILKVNFNEMGQPIGKESMTLAHFIGSCSRRTFPITITDWRNKDLLPLKEKFWDEVKIEQKLREGEEDPVVTRLDTWKHARMNAENQVDDPCSLRILEDVVRITKELEEDELNDIKTCLIEQFL
ncbi:uncharacterized protein A4U43_C07F15630 [Asparagus officinalis]|uniref:Uncharacterized protein n=1 Tax=Asparagus officinalis TaxID=4686 RepID=A0A5P1ECE4_ASPOF|nr:uncharacterized protein A4U43_C07F15630 [Asparagus officinalis]